MANLPMEEIEKMIGSRYALTVLAGKRARELKDGAPRLVNTDARNPIIIALQEIYEGKVVPEGMEPEARVETPVAETEVEEELTLPEVPEEIPEEEKASEEEATNSEPEADQE